MTRRGCSDLAECCLQEESEGFNPHERRDSNRNPQLVLIDSATTYACSTAFRVLTWTVSARLIRQWNLPHMRMESAHQMPSSYCFRNERVVSGAQNIARCMMCDCTQQPRWLVTIAVPWLVVLHRTEILFTADLSLSEHGRQRGAPWPGRTQRYCMYKLSFVTSKSGEELQIDTHGGASIAMLQRLVTLFSSGAFPTCSYGSSAWRV